MHAVLRSRAGGGRPLPPVLAKRPRTGAWSRAGRRGGAAGGDCWPPLAGREPDPDPIAAAQRKALSALFA